MSEMTNKHKSLYSPAKISHQNTSSSLRQLRHMFNKSSFFMENDGFNIFYSLFCSFNEQNPDKIYSIYLISLSPKFLVIPSHCLVTLRHMLSLSSESSSLLCWRYKSTFQPVLMGCFAPWMVHAFIHGAKAEGNTDSLHNVHNVGEISRLIGLKYRKHLEFNGELWKYRPMQMSVTGSSY